MKMLADDQGHATVTSAGLIAALVGLLFTVLAAFHAVLDTHQARLAADLAAVAGAWAQAYGEDGCATAGRTAALNQAEVTGCHPDPGGDLTLSVTVGGREATARAGPL